MRSDLLARAEALRQARTPYVLATVVRAQRPTSAKPGDGALILADGTMDGFVGGTCAESTVRVQGLRLLESGDATLLRITPQADPAGSAEQAEGLVVVHNPCLSGGSLEIFLEAMLPAPLVCVHGDAPVARALMRVGAAAGYEMVACGASVPEDASAVVVASHGRDEEAVLRAALRARVPYVALVASRRRGEAVLAGLGSDGQRVRSPAGLDIGARTAADIAVSILAEIIADRTAPPVDSEPPTDTEPAAAPEAAEDIRGEGVDPVCSMTVARTPGALTAEHAGSTFYFCGTGCRDAFVADPHRYLAHG